MPLFKKDPQFQMLRLRRLADRTSGERVHRYHPVTGSRVLVRPETLAQPDFSYDSMEAEPWPLLGVDVEGEAPRLTSISTSLVSQGKNEGWISSTNDRVVHKSGGPPSDPWAKTHTFLHSDVMTFHFQSGDVSYRVIHQPDKYVDSVDWFYQLERI